MNIIETPRLILRTWQDADVEPYWQINQDPKVLEFLLVPLSIEQVRDFIAKNNQIQLQKNYSLWAVELKENRSLIGFIGLNYTDWPAHFTPAVEIGWRLGSQYWGQGYATEGAVAVLEYGFTKVGLEEIVSFTVPMNERSIKVMQKIGMSNTAEDNFLHPKLTPDHKLSSHVLYRITKNIWLDNT
jgi:RimJ/RimL family protein N-acetyltransferase